MPISPLLQRFVDDELACAAALIEQVRLETVEQLRTQRADPALPPGAARHALQLGHDAAQALAQHAGRYAAAFTAALRDAVTARLVERPAHAAAAGAGTAASAALTLMDDGQVEADIELSRAVLLLGDAVEWEQRELQTFTSALRGDTHVGSDANPFAPEAYALALAQAAAALLQLVPAGQRLLLRVSAAALAPRLKRAYAAACTRIESQGVTPSLYRTQAFRPGSFADRRKADAGPPRLPAYDVTQPGGLEGLLGGARPGGRRAADKAAPAASGPTAPQRSGAAAGGLDRQIVELLSRLFDALLADPALPTAAKATIGRLQASALRVALGDPTLLRAHDHPTWQLMDRIAAALQDAAGEADRLAEAIGFVDPLVDDLVRQPAPDAATYRAALARFDAWAAARLAAEQRAAAAAIESLEQTEHRLRLQTFVQARLEEQLRSARVPTPVRRFLLGPWAALIAGAMLRGGERGDATAAYTRTVDELLWSLETPVDAADRQRLVRLLPGLLQSLRDGMAQLELPVPEQQAFLDELMAAHAMVLQGGSASTPATAAAPESPADIVRRLRDEDDAAVTGSEATFSRHDGVLDLPALDTVPAELLSTDGTAADNAAGGVARRWVDALQPGQPLRLWLAGRWLDARLLWRSQGGGLLLFSGADGLRQALTRHAVERLHAEGLAIQATRVPLIQRAVDGLVAGGSPAPG